MTDKAQAAVEALVEAAAANAEKPGGANAPALKDNNVVPKLDRWLTLREVAQKLGWHRVTVWNKIKSGELPAPTMFGPKSPRLLESTLDNHITTLPHVDYAPADTDKATAHDGPIAA